MRKDTKTQILELVDKYYKEISHGNHPLSHQTTPGFIQYAGTIFDEKELRNGVLSVLEHGWTAGHWVSEFEHKFKTFTKSKHALAVNSGSSANLVAFSTICSPLIKNHLVPGDEVITVAAGFPTTINPIIQNRMVPVFVDINLDTLNIDAEQLEKAKAHKTRAVMIAHTLGNPFDIEAVVDFCNKYNLWLIEDVCDGLGSTYKNIHVGNFGHIATCSFYPAHHITTGEGGMVFTNNSDLYRVAKGLRDWGRDCHCNAGGQNSCGCRFTQNWGALPYGYDHKYVYSQIGYNLKMTETSGAIGCAQIDKIENFIKCRKNNHNKWEKEFTTLSEYFIWHVAQPGADPSWFAFAVTVKDNPYFTRLDLCKYLNFRKIETRNLFGGNLTKQPAYLTSAKKIIGDLPVTNTIMNNTFFLGCYFGIDEDKIGLVIKTIKEFIDNAKSQ